MPHKNQLNPTNFASQITLTAYTSKVKVIGCINKIGHDTISHNVNSIYLYANIYQFEEKVNKNDKNFSVPEEEMPMCGKQLTL